MTKWYQTTFALCALSLCSVAHAETVTITVDTEKPGALINKNIYGQFAEHLGHGIYGGLWVGPDSKIANTRGWRNDVVAALKDLHVPLVRWPGGCFADEYHWRDGVGVRASRPIKINTNWGGVEETNAVGTHEFFDLAEMLGADTYINGNLGSGTVQEMAEWLDYMTGEGNGAMAQLRRKNGREKPFKVDFFAIGNEAWGCGGNMTPQYYTSLFNQYASFLKTPKNNTPKLIASGGSDEFETLWTDYLSTNIHAKWNMNFDAISFHYYTLPTSNWKVKGAATGFPETEWMSALARTLKIEGFIKNNVAVLDKNDPEKKIGFYVDEWGTWYDPEDGTNPAFLRQQNSLRDAVIAALNLNIFHAYSERVQMTNIAQMVNVLQAMILTDGNKMLLTPTYHVFKMYIPFQNAKQLPSSISKNPTYSLEKSSVPALSVSAARATNGKVYVALVNDHARDAQTIELAVGTKFSSAKGTQLTDPEMDAHNTFQNPTRLTPKAVSFKGKKGQFAITLPAKSVSVLELND